MQEHEYEIAIVVSNTRKSSFPLVLEPWGAQANCTVVFRSSVPPTPPNTVEVEYAADSITVWAWDGCRYAVYHDGEVLPPGPFVGPPFPPGVTIMKNAILKPLGKSSTDPDANPAGAAQYEKRRDDS